MVQKARIKLTSTDTAKLDTVVSELRDISEKFGVVLRGPVPLPTKKLRVTTMRCPCGDGTGHGNMTFDKWEMRVHKRLVDVSSDERTLRQIMRITVPDGVQVSIELKD